MSQVMHTVRFVVGMSLLAGGAVLAQPLASALIAARRPPVDVPPAGQPAWRGAAATAASVPPGGHAIPDPLTQRLPEGWSFPGAVPPPGAFAAAGGVAAPPGAGPGGARSETGFVPVPPPTPLPPSSLAFAPAAPELDGTYRSTVDIPPPPLLDAQTPPPLSVGWSPQDVPRAAVMPAPTMPSPAAGMAAAPPAAVPAAAPLDGTAATYVVRDGDDLTSIALGAYGHAGAAAAIWAANADRLSDPSLLPIGLTLRLPPSWTLPASAATAGGGQPAIEPALASVGAGAAVPRPSLAAVSPSDASPAAASSAAAPARMAASSVRGDGAAPIAAGGQHWLASSAGAAGGAGHAGAMAAGMPKPAVTAVPVARRPGAVRVAAGETLDTIAVRFYGDRAMAQRIWLANRDRLRSPDLLVPGMELTLP